MNPLFSNLGVEEQRAQDEAVMWINRNHEYVDSENGFYIDMIEITCVQPSLAEQGGLLITLRTGQHVAIVDQSMCEKFLFTFLGFKKKTKELKIKTGIIK